MERKHARALLVFLAIVQSSIFAIMVVRGHAWASKSRVGGEPFATFRLLDRHLTVLSQQSAGLQKMLKSSPRHNSKAATAMRSTAANMRGTATAIQNLAVRLGRRYQSKPFGRLLFSRLRARAIAVKRVLSLVRSADTPVHARTAASKLDERIVELDMQYNAITAGYAALRCTPGEWTCCEPRRQGDAGQANACRWMCTRQAQHCRGFVGFRAVR